MPTLQLTKRSLQTLIHQAVREELQQALNDPDIGLQLRPEVAKRLRRSQHTNHKSIGLRTVENIMTDLKIKI